MASTRGSAAGDARGVRRHARQHQGQHAAHGAGAKNRNVEGGCSHGGILTVHYNPGQPARRVARPTFPVD